MTGGRLAACALALALGACSSEPGVLDDTLPYYATADLTPLWASEMTPTRARFRVGAFALTDQKGRRVTNRTLAGAPYVVSFLFTSCNGICPPIVHNLREGPSALTPGPWSRTEIRAPSSGSWVIDSSISVCGAV